jgi:hypothetical protein
VISTLGIDLGQITGHSSITVVREEFPTIRESGLAVLNFHGPYYRIIAASPVAEGPMLDKNPSWESVLPDMFVPEPPELIL